MPDPIRHPLNPQQQKQIATLQQTVQIQQNILGAYVQGIADGVGVEGEVLWSLDGTDLVGTPKTNGPVLVKE